MQLSKHHGLGNDFLVLLDIDDREPLTPEAVRRLCDRHRGVGADGVLRAIRGSGGTDVVMELFNADGGRAEMSGNGIGCLVQAVVLWGVAGPDRVVVATDAGERTIDVATTDDAHVHRMTVSMGPAKVTPAEFIGAERAAHVDMGNPHLVVLVDELDSFDMITEGEDVNRRIDGGVNLEAATVTGDATVAMSVYERGVGLTEACGTGACAVAAATHEWGLVPEAVRVEQPGGAVDIVVGADVQYTVPVTF